MTTIQGGGFIVNIIKSKRRKTMALKVDAKGVSAHIPSSLPLATVKIFIDKKTRWIQQKLAQQQHAVPAKQFVDDESLLFLGEESTFHLYDTDTPPYIKKSAAKIEFYGRLNNLSKLAIRAALINWYKKQATSYLTARTKWFSDISDLHPASITIKSYKARWGSCSSNGNINFNWQLVLASPDIIDYVIIHELCHLTHHNHSAKFWSLVKHFIPDFKLRRQWLKENGHTLLL